MPNPYQQYQQNMVKTASPAQLVLMLYNGALRFIKQAQISLAAKQLEECHQNIIKAQRIVTELMLNLDLSQGVIAQNLYQLYDYMYQRLVEANLQKTEAPLQEVEQLLQELKNTWSEAIKLMP
ncbi:MAG: flagellar export chaperone FliS [Firmicutes bacterium]|nr:flagellar export chaperone FliS [Bacillota bacterium]